MSRIICMNIIKYTSYISTSIAKVKIISGPFKDMMAKIDSVDMKEQKLTVLVDLFGQETSVEVDIQEVETL